MSVRQVKTQLVILAAVADGGGFSLQDGMNDANAALQNGVDWLGNVLAGGYDIDRTTIQIYHSTNDSATYFVATYGAYIDV